MKIKDVAKKAGVHASVVSRVLNHDATLKIKKETRERNFDAKGINFLGGKA